MHTPPVAPSERREGEACLIGGFPGGAGRTLPPRGGRSRNKVAVPEGAAGSPPQLRAWGLTYVSVWGGPLGEAREGFVPPGRMARSFFKDERRAQASAESASPRPRARRHHAARWMARLGRRGRARQAAICPGEAQAAVEPGIPEWDFPPGVNSPWRSGNPYTVLRVGRVPIGNPPNGNILVGGGKETKMGSPE